MSPDTTPHRTDVLRLAIPAFFTLIAEPLFLMTDSAIIGHLGTVPLAALAAASALLTSTTGIFVFLAYATTASVAQLIGAGRRKDALAAGVDGAWLAIALGVPLALLTAALAHPLSEWVAGATVADAASTYLRISALSLPAILLNLALTGLFRGLADTRTPLVVTMCGFALNAALNAILILGLDTGIAGSAWGTTISTWAMTLAQYIILTRNHRTPIARPHPTRLFRAMRTGTPLLIRTVALRGILILLTALIGSFSVTALAAHQIVSNVFTFESFALDALAIAAQTLIGQALGRGAAEEVRALTTLFLRWALSCGVGFGVIVCALAPIVPHLFTQTDAVSGAATWCVALLAALTPIAAVLFVLDGILMGAGDGVFLAKVQAGLFILFFACFVILRVLHSQMATLGVPTQLLICWGLYGVILTLRMALLWQRSRTDYWMTFPHEAK